MSTDGLAGVTADGDVEGGRPDHEGRDAILLGRRPRPGLWFTLNRADAIGRYAPVDGETTIVPLPTQGAGPVGLAVGPDEALWFTETNAGQSAG
jgi:virginiamycin B lyase